MIGIVPVISLWQPFASAIFLGRKTYETRPFRYPRKYHGERIAIHATVGFTPKRFVSPELDVLCREMFGDNYREELPRGVILGTVKLGGCFETTSPEITLRDDEYPLGDYTPGRFAWRLEDVQALDRPIPAKGKQGWWKADLRG